jgi:hypothetical protein
MQENIKATRETLMQTQPEAKIKTLEMELEDQAWMDADLSRLGEFEPYDWGDVDPKELGKPICYESGKGFVVVGGKKIE